MSIYMSTDPSSLSLSSLLVLFDERLLRNILAHPDLPRDPTAQIDRKMLLFQHDPELEDLYERLCTALIMHRYGFVGIRWHTTDHVHRMRTLMDVPAGLPLYRFFGFYRLNTFIPSLEDTHI